jgi:hypothetical protein
MLENLKTFSVQDIAEFTNYDPTTSSDENVTDPVFLVGFPRSGTTLLGQILDSHSSLVLIEEQAMLDLVIDKISNGEGKYPDCLDNLSQDDIKELRGIYFDCAHKYSSPQPGQVIIDKFPLHIVHVALIQKIFPKARYIFAQRHPCDAVLSCFMQSFTPNPAMANFFSLPRAARTYDLVMSLWDYNRDLFCPNSHVIRYEDVIDDFDIEIDQLLSFLGLEWESNVRNYAENARSKGRINTPSYHQVTEKIYTRSRYRWKRYTSELSPVMVTLDPWIDKFGYADENT